MRATISRKIVETKVFGFAIDVVEDEPKVTKLDPITLYGNVSQKEAMKELTKAYPDAVGITVSKIESEEVQYEISVEDFVKNATRIEQVKMTEEKEND